MLPVSIILRHPLQARVHRVHRVHKRSLVVVGSPVGGIQEEAELAPYFQVVTYKPSRIQLI